MATETRRTRIAVFGSIAAEHARRDDRVVSPAVERDAERRDAEERLPERERRAPLREQWSRWGALGGDARGAES